jgi:diguanylate cyclase (GGDEF)-like protein/PAS domain S-box-containing protein
MLILDPSSNEAEQTINILRNNGHAVRATQITNEDELETALEQQRWDLFVVRDGLESPSAEECIKIVQHYGRDIPFVMTTHNYSVERTLEAMRLGMQDVVPADNDEYFRLVIERELSAIEAKKTQAAASSTLKEIEKRNELLLDSSRDAIAYMTDGMHIYANHAYMELFGYEDEDELACIPIIDLVDSEQQDEFKQYLKNHLKGENQAEFEFHGVKESGETFEAVMTLTASQYDGEDCTQVYLKMSTADDGELAEKLREMSEKDRLTGLFNQEHLLDALEQAKTSAQQDNALTSLLYIELDHFDNFLSEFGISEMDNYIKQIAHWLVDIADDAAEIARIGDSNFALLVQVNKPEEGSNKADTLRAAFAEKMFDISQKTYMDTISIGICTVSEKSPEADKILSNAHFACTRAHAKGGNQIKVHDITLDKLDNREEAQIAVEIEEAIENGKLRLTFEPIVKLKGDIESMYHCQLGVEKEPGNLVPLLEVYDIGLRSATAAKLDQWLLEHAFAAMKEHLANTPGSVMKINLSPASILDEQLANHITALMSQVGVAKEAFILEFNEEHVVSHLKHSLDLFNALHAAGITIALGDFGSSLTSTEMLGNLGNDKVQWLSIDHALMKCFLSNTKAQVQVEELLQFAHDHEFKTIVPDLADAGSLALIWPMNADHIHGSYIAHPGPEMDFNFEENSFF